MNSPLKIAISAEFDPDGGVGGVGSVVLGLLRALDRLDDGDERYKVIVPFDSLETYRPFASSKIELVPRSVPPERSRPAGLLRRAMRPAFHAARRIVDRVASPRPSWPVVPLSDGFYERLGCEVLHFPHQGFVLTSIPTIYNPHDLQHRHLPEFFSPQTIAWRETTYPFACRTAAAVPVASSWVRDDLVRAYGLDRSKICVIPWAPPTEAFAAPTDDELIQVRRKYGLPEEFAFYPAITWPHKNHARLIDAVALLRERGEPVHLVCCGNQKEPEFSRLQSQVREHGLEDLVRMVGRVSGDDLRSLFRLATCCVVPTLFEAASAPVFEAWEAGLPVACSRVTSLPSQVGDAGVLFDPYSVEEIADALAELMCCPETRADYARRGRRRLQDFCWLRTARAYRALYRRVGRRTLTDEDCRLLAWNWMEQDEPRRAQAVTCP